MKCRLTFFDIDYDWEPCEVSSIEELRQKAEEFFFEDGQVAVSGREGTPEYTEESYPDPKSVASIRRQIDALTGEKEEFVIGGGLKETMYVTPIP